MPAMKNERYKDKSWKTLTNYHPISKGFGIKNMMSVTKSFKLWSSMSHIFAEF